MPNLYFLCFLCLLYFPLLGYAQEQFAEPAEISRALLYHPAQRIEAGRGSVIFRAAQFTYRFDPGTGQWTVKREANFSPAEIDQPLKTYKDARRKAEYRFTGIATQDEGILEIRPGAGPETEVLARLTLWNRTRLVDAWFSQVRQNSPNITGEQLERELEVAEPEVAGLTDDGTYLWLAMRHYAGEGYLGLGSVVRFDPATGGTRVFQPSELATSSVTHIALTGQGQLWLGTRRQGEGAIEPTAGLVRFDPATGEARSYLPGSSRLVGRIVTALDAEGNLLWVATDAGMCRIARPGDPPGEAAAWTCWRIVPTVRLAAPEPVSNRPGGPPRVRLPAGSYEVRWANAGFFELITPDGVEGWLETDDLEEYAGRNFDAEAYELGNTYGGGAGVMRLLTTPRSDPLAAAQVYRVPLERLGSPREDRWQRVRARAGWISRKGLEVAPVIQPASE